MKKTVEIKNDKAIQNEQWMCAWQKADAIVEQIKEQEPEFGGNKVCITDFGARVSAGHFSKEEIYALTKTNTKAIIAAVRHISSLKDGGTVFVPEGIFYTAAIHLESHVNLHLCEGAVLRFHTDPKLYTGEFLDELYGQTHVLTRFEGVELMNYSPFLYAYGKEDIAITGLGTLDGQASEECWHPWKNRKHPQPQEAARIRLFMEGETNVPVAQRIYGEASAEPGKCDDGYLRPSFIETYCCKRILIENVHIINSPMWEIHPVLCENVTVRSVRIETHLSNNDGVDPECCRNVLIENCLIDVGDDCIAIKSGRNEDARRVGRGTERIVIQNNIFKDGHGGITIGSEISGGVREVYVRGNVMESPRLWSAFRFKTSDIRGGIIEDCYYKDNQVRQIEEGKKAVLVETQYEIATERAIFAEHGVIGHTSTPEIRNIFIEGQRPEDACIDGENISPEIFWIS